MASGLLSLPLEKYMANVIDKLIWEKTGVSKFSKMLDLSAYRHKLISGNVANVTTPGYAAKDIDFNDEMRKALGSGQTLAMKVTDSKHIPNVGPDSKVKVIETPGKEGELNGVDIDTEVTNMSVNQINYTVGAQLLQKQVSALRKVITSR